MGMLYIILNYNNKISPVSPFQILEDPIKRHEYHVENLKEIVEPLALVPDQWEALEKLFNSFLVQNSTNSW